MTAVKTYAAIVPAAGIGSRMNSLIAKQYIKIGNKTVIEHTLDALLTHPQIDTVIVVLHPQDSTFDLLSVANNPAIKKVIGGDERVDSVLSGLHYCRQLQTRSAEANSQDEWVLVHDAARPCITHAELNDLLAAAEYCDGAILAVPVVDTIKRSSNCPASKNIGAHKFASIQQTVDRTHLWHAQTPQFFPLKKLIEAIQAAQQNNALITDEASAMEQTGANIKLVEGRFTNVKITRPSDLALAEFYLHNNNYKK